MQRNRLPRGPHDIPPEEVTADQKRRLKDAMVALGGTAGYADTTVAHLIKYAGVSRKTFYALYPDRKPLLKETFDECWRTMFDEVKQASQRSGGRTRQIEALTRRLCRIGHSRKGSIGLCTYEIAAANPEGLRMREEMVGEYGSLIQSCLRSDGESEVSDDIAGLLAGAIHREIDALIRAGREDELSEAASSLARWVRSHDPVPQEIARLPEDGASGGEEALARSVLGPESLAGGRAPGTLVMAPESFYTHRAPRSEGFKSHANRERILDAVAHLASEEDYEAVTAERIIDRADVPERTFYKHFKNREEAFAAAVELGHVKAQAVVDRARALAPDWRTGVRAGVFAFLEFMATEPHFTRMAFLRVPAAGPSMMRRSNEHAAAYGRLLFDRAPQRRRPGLIVPETIVHALFELAYWKASKDEARSLAGWSRPATFMALAPFLGTAEAASVAVG